MANKPSTEKRLAEIELQLAQRKKDQQQILLERIRDRKREDIYSQMLETCEKDIERLTAQITEFKNVDATIKKRKSEMKKSVELIDSIVADGAISDTHLRMLVEQIVIYETDGKLRVQIMLNGEFRRHFDYYNEDGEMIGRDAEAWVYPCDGEAYDWVE